MSPSLRKKLLIGGGGFVGVLIIVLLVAPSFFDLNKYKPELVAQVKQATGRDLVLDGPVTLSLLPTPSVSVSSVHFVNVPGSKNPNMVEVKSITVKPSLIALLGGNIEVSSVTLVEPKIVLEVNADGKPNWEFAPSAAQAKPAAAQPASSMPLSLGSLVIDNGTLLFSDPKAGISMVAEKANFTASIGSLDGPYALSGSASLNGAPLKIDASVGGKGTNGYATDLSLEANGKLGLKGTLSELGPNASFAGVATVATDSLTGFVTTLMGLAGQPVPPLPPLLAGKFSFDGSIEASQTDFVAKDFKTSLNDSSGSGTLSVRLKPALVVEGKVTSSKLDLDKALAELTPQGKAPSKPALPTSTTSPAAAASTNASLLDGITAKVSLDIGEVTYNKQAVRNVGIDLDARNGVVAVPRLTATLPGDMVLQAKSTLAGDPGRPAVSGDFSLVGPKLRDTLKWLDVDISSVPGDKLNTVSLKGRMTSSRGNVEVTDAAFELDDLKGTGGMLVTFSVPLSVVTHIEINTLNADSFMPPPGEKKAASAAKPVPAAAVSVPAVEALGPSLGLKLKVAKVIYNKASIGGVDLDVALQGSRLKLNHFDVSNFGGARFALRGSVANATTPMPRPDVAFNFEAPDIDGVLKIVGAAPSGLGKVTVTGGLAGTAEQMTLRDLTVSATGETAKASGVLSLPGAGGGAPTGASYKGSLTLNDQTIEGSVSVTLTGRPTVTADLKTTLMNLDKLSLASGSPRPASPPARGQPAAVSAAAKPIDTTPMRSVDASVKLVAATLISSAVRVNNADLALTLKNGVLTVEHFKGGLFGGTLALSGVVDGSKPALAIDFKGDANNILLGEMLRETSGTNTFGREIKVTIDGKLNATGIAIKGSGATSDQIKSSMAGGAELGGYIFAGADKALIALGGAATGVVGGVIDNTLGTALGAIGQNGGTGVGNMLNAASLLLNRFVNRDNPISGHVEIAGGVLTDKSLVVQGNRATANIATRTNLATSTTDTTVNFMIAEDGSGPYVTTTARGPISSPSLNVARGSAKDPPGFVNTLTNGITGGVQQVPSILPRISIPNIFGR